MSFKNNTIKYFRINLNIKRLVCYTSGHPPCGATTFGIAADPNVSFGQHVPGLIIVENISQPFLYSVTTPPPPFLYLH